jgi:lipopolysaccharide export system permease protein
MRMSGDNEIAALKSGGVSLYKLLPPIGIFAVAGCLATLFMTVYGMPQGKMAIKAADLSDAGFQYRYRAQGPDL